MAMRQSEIVDISNEVDGELTDIQLVERVLELQQDKKRIVDGLKRTQEQLARRLARRGVTEELIGDHRIVVDRKLLTYYDQNTLASLKNCTTDDQVWVTFKQIPSGKQLKALSDLAGASAKAVISSAKRKDETDTIIVKIKKPRKAKQRRGW
jgi:hypothetical protein